MKRSAFKIFVLIALFCCGHSLLGQNRSDKVVDPKAKALLDKATAHFDSKNGLSADFMVLIENTRNDKKESIPGKIQLKGDKFKLSVAGVVTYFDGKTQSVFMQDANEVTISNPSAADLKDINPLLLMKSYQQGYKMKYMGARKEGGKTYDVVELYPDNLKGEYSIISITIEKESMAFHSIRMQGKGGVNTMLTVTKTDTEALPDSLFVFNPSSVKGIEVVDLR
ncbi:MAG: LolA-like putative outer membrane lipoprotein chaperone [Paludibacteraceae bacterium]